MSARCSTWTSAAVARVDGARYDRSVTSAKKHRLEVEGITLLWGNPTEWKAELRDESRVRNDGSTWRIVR